jgi:hypothetical protein
MRPESTAARGFTWTNAQCDAEYLMLIKDLPPLAPPRCERCGRAFAAREDGKYLHYVSMWFD